MARALTKTVKSVNIGIVKSTEVGTHNVLYTFGSRNVINSAANTTIKTVVGSTADVTEPWTMTLIVPEKFKFRTLTSVETTTGAITSSFYSTSFDVDGNVIVSFDASAEDPGGVITNGEDVTIIWTAFDDTTLHSTIFSVKVQSDNSGHVTTVLARFTEGGTQHTFKLHPGDSVRGPFSELQVSGFSNANASAFVYYQEH